MISTRILMRVKRCSSIPVTLASTTMLKMSSSSSRLISSFSVSISCSAFRSTVAAAVWFRGWIRVRWRRTSSAFSSTGDRVPYSEPFSSWSGWGFVWLMENCRMKYFLFSNWPCDHFTKVSLPTAMGRSITDKEE